MGPRPLLPLLAVLVGWGCGEAGGAGESGARGPASAGGPAAAVAPAGRPTPRPLADSSWAALVLRLSEPGGYFDTDNLVSNETSYLHVMGALERLGVEGGVYLGVGPDQN
ncbi:MAG TPA: hypothetical protein VLL48_09700, partial [Longimicrobiales bacterium]|nr:hypothetical protein [Longimicrobiales bacterium]